jgi:hypothetical protein
MAPESLENMTEAAENQARKAMQAVQDFTRDAGATLDARLAQIREFVRAYPLQILAATVGVGYILGKLTRR